MSGCTSTAGWWSTPIHAGRDVAFVPLDDTIVHYVHRSEDCPCGPEIEVVSEDGALMFSHHALDGRE